jgi:hypothetical protein
VAGPHRGVEDAYPAAAGAGVAQELVVVLVGGGDEHLAGRVAAASVAITSSASASWISIQVMPCMVRPVLTSGRARTRKGGVAGVQVRQVAHAVSLVGAYRAAFIRGRIEHEVLDDELAPALEHVQQAHRPGRPVEQVFPRYSDGGQFPAALADVRQCLGCLLLCL